MCCFERIMRFICRIDWNEALPMVISVAALIATVCIHIHEVKREKQILTMSEVSRIRRRYPNMNPKAKHPVSDKIRLKYLREMERFCTGVNNGVYDFETLQKLSGHFLYTQYNKYMRDFVRKRRKSKEESEWKYNQYEKVMKKLGRKYDED